MNKELDLTGLKKVFAGLVLQLISAFLIGRLAGGLMTGDTVAGIISCVINAAAIVLILAGLSGLRKASMFFIQARKYFLIQLILQGVLVVCLIVLGRSGWTVDSIQGMARSTIIEILLLAIVLLAVWIVSMLFSVRTVLRGCSHVAEQTNDPLFSMKCIKTWRFWYMAFLLTILMMMSGLAVIVTVLKKTIGNGAAGQDLTEAIFTNVTSSVLLVSIIGMVVLIFLLIAHIMYLSKVRTAYREYHLEEVVIPAAAEQKPVFADYVQNELGDTGNGAEETEYEEYPEPEEYAEDTDETDEGAVYDGDGYEDPDVDPGKEEVKTRYPGRKYRKISQVPEEEAVQDTEQILEITKLFRKNSGK